MKMPEVPLRQWVLSVPFELRLLLARDPRALTAVGRIFVQEIFRSQRERARRSGLRSTASGAVCFPQRFGGSMNFERLTQHERPSCIPCATLASQSPENELGARRRESRWQAARAPLQQACDARSQRSRCAHCK